MFRAIFSLLIIGGVCGALLVGTHALTAEDITLNREARARALITAMLGEELPPSTDLQALPIGTCEGWIIQRITVGGYAGDIELLSLWRTPDRLTLRVTSHRETPGIGDFIDHERDAWTPQLDGTSMATFAEVDNVSGATITTNAIRDAAAASAQGVEAYCRG